MEGKKVIFFEVEPWEQAFLKDKLEHYAHLTFYPHRLTKDTVREAEPANYVATFIYSDLSEPVIDHLVHTRGLVTMSVGTDHIDVDAANRRGLTVCNVPNYGPNTVAEHTLALLLALSRNIVPSVERTKKGQYDYTGLSGWDLAGKTLGLIGTGKIGSRVARAARSLDMVVIAHDQKPDPLLEKISVKYVSFDELLRHADVISLHAPLRPETKHMLSRKEFAQMKRGMVLINTARGALIDTAAFIEALDSGIISQAGIDVLEDEWLLKEERQFFSRYFNLTDYQTALADHALMRDPRVLVTPHNAFNSKESLANILQTTVDNLLGLLHGDPVNVVNK